MVTVIQWLESSAVNRDAASSSLVSHPKVLLMPRNVMASIPLSESGRSGSSPDGAAKISDNFFIQKGLTGARE